MPHVFKPEDRQKLDSPERQKLLPARRILEKLDISEGQTIADIGCGTGFFSIPAAEITGPQGLVYSADIHQEMLDDLKSKAASKNLPNISTVLCTEEDPSLPQETFDLVLLMMVGHELPVLPLYMTRLYQLLKENGKLAVLEWEKKKSETGPPVEDRIAESDLRVMFVRSGFWDIQKISLDGPVYLLTARKGN